MTLAQVFDEASMIPPELLCDIDTNNRIAKETDSIFGAIDTYFIADFYQYPPVAATPLYSPLTGMGGNQAHLVKRKVSRYLWLQIDHVIEFETQFRQKTDPELALAIRNLRTKSCSESDLALLNSRVIRSESEPEGIDMGLDRGPEAVVLTYENIPRILLNDRKVESVCAQSQLNLIQCYAHDQALANQDQMLTEDIKDRLLQTDGIGGSKNEELLSLLSFYVGCPVVVRHKNLATELKVSKGTQGILKKVYTKPLTSTKRFATAAIVHFPRSTVQLAGLERGDFVVFPITFRYKISIGNGKLLRIARTQLPIHPAWAFTGESSQGRTLPAVVMDARMTGRATAASQYVQLSRATTRKGLFLTYRLTLKDLNNTLWPKDLIFELRRLKALAHNTLVQFELIKDSLVDVPHAPDSARLTNDPRPTIVFKEGKK